MRSEDEKKEKCKIVKQTYFLYFLFFIVGIFSIIGSWILFEFFIDSNFITGFTYTPLIILSYFIYSFYHFTIQYVFKAKKTILLGVMTCTSSIIQVVLSYYLIDSYGVIGAVYSMLIGNLLITVCVALYSNKVYPMPWVDFFRGG